MSMNFKFKVGKKTVSVRSEYTHPVVTVDGEPTDWGWSQSSLELTFADVDFGDDKPPVKTYIVTDEEAKIEHGDMISIYMEDPVNGNRRTFYGLLDKSDEGPYLRSTCHGGCHLPSDWERHAHKIVLFEPDGIMRSGDVPRVKAKAG